MSALLAGFLLNIFSSELTVEKSLPLNLGPCPLAVVPGVKVNPVMKNKRLETCLEAHLQCEHQGSVSLLVFDIGVNSRILQEKSNNLWALVPDSKVQSSVRLGRRPDVLEAGVDVKLVLL